MKKSIFVTKLIFALVLIVIGFIGIFSVIGYFLDHGIQLANANGGEYTFKQLLKDSPLISFYFYASIMAVVGGIYRIVCSALSFEFNKKTKEDEFAVIGKYKALLDSGIITQEEFEIKKREILN